ncbi:LysR family transcriptional regulator [Pseudomonas sp. NA-150]|uniref:LysR family transcriptional regulator n=1 Tax=Pseudomonas sp. NA-150 TaxID=3367525 RepID=UPI0037C6900B
MHDIDLALLRAFVATAQTGSISAAAQRLHLTQGGVSLRLKRLEDFFASRLLERTAQGTRLTAQGARLLPQALRLLKASEQMYRSMSESTVAEKPRVGVPYDLVGSHFPPILKAFMQAHPAAEVALVCDSSSALRERLHKGELDIAIAECPLTEACAEHLATEPLVWVGGGEAHALRPLPLCLVSETCEFRPTLFSRLNQKRIPYKIVFGNATIEATASTVRSDLAVTAWLASTVPHDLRILGADSRLPVLEDFAIELHLPEGEHSMAVKDLAGLIREHYRASSRWSNQTAAG